MSRWPDGWQNATLRYSGLLVSQFALDVLNMWEQSTPTAPWTNNPLGMPSRGTGMPRALNTPYAVFPNMQAFRNTFKIHVVLTHGKSLASVLDLGENMASAWREIHGLGWPANKTESEYPAKLLDHIEQKYQEKVRGVGKRKNKSAGMHMPDTVAHDMVRNQHMAMRAAMLTTQGYSQAIRHVVRSLGENG